MIALISMASLALAGTSLALPSLKATRQTTDEATTVASNTTLTPIAVDGARLNIDTLTPRTNVTLPYGLGDTNFVNVTLTVPEAVLLEAITSLTTVDCAADSVIMTFASTADVDAAYAAWSTYESLVLITNHLGDCDTELERGFFVSSVFTVSESSLIAGVQKTDVASIASYLRANFTGLPGQSNTLTPASAAKRDIDALTISNVWNLPAMTLYELDPYIKATANSGSLAVAVTLDGYLDFNILTFSLDALWVDVSTSTSVDLELELAVNAPYNNTFSYGNAIQYYVINVPGILTFGPELSFAVGADVGVDAAVDILLDVGAEIANGSIHLDFVDGQTAATNWVPTYYANLTLSEKAAVDVAPYVAVTVGLDFEILGGLLDLSGGLTPRVEFPVNATLDGTQVVGAAGTTVVVTQPGADGKCTNGLEVVSDFGFSLVAFVTQFWSQELYAVTVPLANECYSWV